MPAESPAPQGPPKLRRDNYSAVRAYNVLRQFRQHQIAPDGFKEPQRLSFDDIERYANRLGPYDPDGFAVFLSQIGAMEDVYIAVVMEKIALERQARSRRG